jgi:two-component system sensor histidine kinase BaeS
MKMKLAYKLFCSSLLTAIVIVALLVGMQYYAMRNFAEYVNRAQLDSLGTLEANLIKAHDQYGGWDFLRHNPRSWRDLLLEARVNLRPPHFPPRPLDGLDEPPEPTAQQPLAEDDRHDRGLVKDPLQESLGPPPVFRIGRRLALFDAEKTRVRGNLRPFEEHTVKALKSGNQNIGWLGLYKVRRFSDPVAAAFRKRQLNFIFLTGGAALVLTALVTVVMSRQILRPVKALSEGTQTLISRRFKTRIGVKSSDELGQLAADFNTMAETLEHYETMRQQWLSDISHELRTPLAVLRGEIEALEDGIRQVNAETIASLHNGVIRLGKLVDDLHLLSLSDSGSLLLKKTKIDPIGLLGETLKVFHQLLEERSLRMELDIEEECGATMEADGDRLKQVFSNILENTLRYAEMPGTVRISGHCTEQTLTICFEDSGPGVPPETLKRLFDRLYRVDSSRSRELGGSGLGLAICKQIVEAHGGRIVAESSGLGGLSIKIRFPLT